MHLGSNNKWLDYELIDSGGFEKLERYGPYIIRRPEPQALWDKYLSEKDWMDMADASFIKSKGTTDEGNERGEWNQKKGMPGQWFVTYNNKEYQLKMRLGLTSFKHVGLFPEQAENWDFIFNNIKKTGTGATVLNLFAYTGGASLAARAAGADITHVDSVKQVVTWANENMQASGLDNIRWVVEDAVKFVKREVKRGKKYNGIILDPPAYGRGPEGEKWLLEAELNNLLKNCRELLHSEKHFVVLNLYSMGFSSMIARSLMGSVFKTGNPECLDLCFTDRGDRILPLGVVSRFSTI